MFDNIKNLWKEYRYKKKLIRDFMQEHSKYIPKYSPQVQPLYWVISTYKDGDYDIYTGKQHGEYKISISQRCPTITCDTQVYEYNCENKSLEVMPNCRWES